MLPKELQDGILPAERKILELGYEGESTTRLDFRTGNKQEDDPGNSENWSPDRNIRASFLCWLCTNEASLKVFRRKVVDINGVNVQGDLHLEFSTILRPLGLLNCSIRGTTYLYHAKAKLLNFQGSHMGCIKAPAIRVEGSVLIRNANIKDGVYFNAAKIGGGFQCTGSIFENKEGRALEANGIDVGRSVFLRDNFHAKGTVSLTSAVIGSDLDCSNATFEGGMEDDAFIAQRAEIKNAFCWRNTTIIGRLDLANTKVGQLYDEKESWPDKGMLALDGFEYNSFAGDSPANAKERLEWIRLGEDITYKPQPYEQLTKAFRKMGHDSDAKLVLIAKQKAREKYGDLNFFQRLYSYLFGFLLGYGWQPRNTIGIIICFVVLGSFFFNNANKINLMQPTKERVYMSTVFKHTNTPPSLYPKFHPIIYSIDTFVPFVNLHQESYWLPDENKPVGRFYHSYLWVHIMFGWFFSTLAAVGFTGLVRKE